MAINLSKGSKISLKKESPAGKTFVVGLGWDTGNAANFDLDASAFIVGENGKILSDEYFVFYNNKQAPDGSVIYSGDNRTGAGEGDDETLIIDTTKIKAEVQQIVFCCSINDAEERKQNFSMVSNAYIRIYEQGTGAEVATYYLAEAASNETAFILGRLLNSSEGWVFEACPMGYPGGLDALVEIYA